MITGTKMHKSRNKRTNEGEHCNEELLPLLMCPQLLIINTFTVAIEITNSSWAQAVKN